MATDPDQGAGPTAEDWASTSFEGARREQLRRWSQLPLRQVILALEEMEEISRRLASPSRGKGAAE
jgi:hypothetical protein